MGVLELMLLLLWSLHSNNFSFSVCSSASSNRSSCSSFCVRSRVVCWEGFQEVLCLMFLSFLSPSNLDRVVLELGCCPLDLSTWGLWVPLFLSHLGLLSLVMVELFLVKLRGWAVDMGSLSAILSKLSVDNFVLLKSKRERDIAVQVALYTNTMSKGAVEHNMRLADIVTDLVDTLSFGGKVIHAKANNLPQMNKAV